MTPRAREFLDHLKKALKEYADWIRERSKIKLTNGPVEMKPMDYPKATVFDLEEKT